MVNQWALEMLHVDRSMFSSRAVPVWPGDRDRGKGRPLVQCLYVLTSPWPSGVATTLPHLAILKNLFLRLSASLNENLFLRLSVSLNQKGTAGEGVFPFYNGCFLINWTNFARPKK